MKAVLLSLAVLLASVIAQEPPRAPEPKGEIHGRVTDAQTGRPIAGAAVSVSARGQNTTMTMVTDDNGVFRFRGLAPGVYAGDVMPGPMRGTHRPVSLLPSRDAGIELGKDEVRQ